MVKKDIIHKLGERKKMFEDYLALLRRQPRLQVNNDSSYASTNPKKPGNILEI